MTPAQRILAYAFAAFAGILVLIWMAGGGDEIQPPAVSTATPTASPEPTTTPTEPAPPPGYRLSGVAVGGDTAYATIENPGGGTSLYRLNAKVPGLGTIVRIDGERVVVRTAGGDFDMWVAPAPTPTFSATRRSSPRMVTPTPARTQPAAFASPSPESLP